jgi:hypothetical protein
MDGMDPVCFDKSPLQMLPLISPLNINVGENQCTQMSMVHCCLHLYFINQLCFMIWITDLKNMEKNYSPVTYLPTMYKTITYLSSERMQRSTIHKNLMPKQQKGCCTLSKGCQDHLLISNATLQECYRKKKIHVVFSRSTVFQGSGQNDR